MFDDRSPEITLAETGPPNLCTSIAFISLSDSDGPLMQLSHTHLPDTVGSVSTHYPVTTKVIASLQSRDRPSGIQVDSVIIEHQAPHLDALAWLLVLLRWVDKRRVGNAASDSWRSDRVVTLDERHLIGTLRVLEIPTVSRAWFDDESLAVSMRINQSSSEEIRLCDRVGIGDGERIFQDGFDRPPDLKGKMSAHPRCLTRSSFGGSWCCYKR